jgi:hypothetical protein
VGDVFYNLEKAFDCVNHDLLRKKLKFYGIVGNAYALINSYLIDNSLTHSFAFFRMGED